MEAGSIEIIQGVFLALGIMDICDRKENNPVILFNRFRNLIFLKLRRKTNSNFFLPQIDGLRFLAIGLVVLIHINVFYLAKNNFIFDKTLTDYPIYFSFLYNGFKGVELFFVISGFILALPFAKHYLCEEDKIPLKEYFWRRLTRLEPPYIVAMLSFFLIFIFIGKYSFVQLWPSLLLHLTYIHNFFNNFPNLSGVTWSLEIELQFYLLAPVLSSIFSLNKFFRRFILFGSIIFLPILQNIFNPSVITLYNFLQFFLVGFLLVDFYLAGFRLNLAKISSLLLGLASLLVIIFLDFSSSNIGISLREPLLNRIVFPFVIFLFYFLVLTDNIWKNLFSNKFFTSIGGMCYTIYLWHTIIISAVGNQLIRVRLSENFLFDFSLKLSFLFILVILFSAILFLIIEKPTMDKNWPKKLYYFVREKFNWIYYEQK